jgi:DNA-directed RNA polymerase specialized sigma subunit
MLNKAMKERAIERYLKMYHTYLLGIQNSQKQLDYIMPTMVSNFAYGNENAHFYISNDTGKVALDRIESKRALDLKEDIEQYKIITNTIEAAYEQLKGKEKDFVKYRYFEGLEIYEIKEKMGYQEEKSLYRIRRIVLDKLLISLNNLLTLK